MTLAGRTQAQCIQGHICAWHIDCPLLAQSEHSPWGNCGDWVALSPGARQFFLASKASLQKLSASSSGAAAREAPFHRRPRQAKTQTIGELTKAGALRAKRAGRSIRVSCCGARQRLGPAAPAAREKTAAFQPPFFHAS